MIENTPAAGRANRKGSPCPAWCTADHGRILIDATEDRAAVLNFTHISQGHVVRDTSFHALVVASQSGYPGNPAHIYVTAEIQGEEMSVSDPGDARALAAIIGKLADATPEQHRQIADAVASAARFLGDLT
jgi:hypothetical protein